MSFFNLSTGGKAESTTEAEMGGGDFKAIPAGTYLKAMVEDAKWKEANEYSDRRISLTWLVLDGEFKGRKVFHNVKVCDQDGNKRDKALRMFAAIDANAGGKLIAADKEPTDYEMLSALANKPMTIQVQVFKTKDENGEDREINWVSSIGSANGTKKQAAPQKQEPDITKEMDSDIGF